MATLNERFPYALALGFEGGSAYVTDVAELPSGKDKRNSRRENAKGRWVATQQHKTHTLTKELIKYFHACMGRKNDFPFRDWTDYKVESGEGVLQLISGDTYQLYKRYVKGGITTTRKIIRPISAVVAGGGSYSVSTSTGVVTRNSGAVPTGWTGQFDCLCRLNVDSLDDLQIVNRKGNGGEFIYTWGNISFSEVSL